MRSFTAFTIKRKSTNSRLTLSLPGDVSARAIRIWVANDEWCRQVRQSGFELDESEICLVCDTARE